MTLKQNFVPWSHSMKNGWSIEPLTASIYINTVYGHEFWKSQPRRYSDAYYNFMSTKFRLNIALGQRVTMNISNNRTKLFAKNISFFYEISSCDLYIRSLILDHTVSLNDIIGLSLGVRVCIL